MTVLARLITLAVLFTAIDSSPALAEVGMVFGPIDVGLRGGFALLSADDAAATAEFTAGVRFF